MNDLELNAAIEWANSILSGSTESQVEYREGVMHMIEQVLLSLDAYGGHYLLSEAEVPSGCRPGIRKESNEDSRFSDTDSSRVRYILK